MRNKIEKLDLVYGVSIFNIMNKYDDFKELNQKKFNNAVKKLDDFYHWLSNNEDITSINIINATSSLLEDNEIRSFFINEEFSTEEFYDIVTYKISDIDFKNINKEIESNEDYYYINYLVNEHSDRNNKVNGLDFIKSQIYSSNLLYSDLLILLLNNCIFPRKLENMSANNWTIHFINALNIMCYEMDKLLNSNRDNLYYAMLKLFDIYSIRTYLYPSSMGNYFNLQHESADIERFIYNVIIKGFHNLNQFYYVEVPKFNYNNSRKHIPLNTIDKQAEFIITIFGNLNLEDKMYILNIATFDKDYLYTNNDIIELERFVKSIENNDKLIIQSQTTRDEEAKLIQDSFFFAEKYCKEKKFKIIECSLKPDFGKKATTTFINICIRYNKFDYKFTLSKYNRTYTWKVTLKDNKYYKINLYLKDDFKHIAQAMLND